MRSAGPLLLALNLASRRLYAELVSDLGVDVGFTPRGILMLCHTQRGLDEAAAMAAAARDLGLDARVLDRAAVRALEGSAERDVVGAVHVAEDAHLDPGALMQALPAHLERTGVRFALGTEVTGVRDHGTGAEVELRMPERQRATLRGDVVVIAAGSWSAPLVRRLGLRILLQPGKGYSLTIERPSQYLSTAAILVEARVSVTLISERFRIGGTMEIGGFDERVNQARLEGIRSSARRYFPQLPRAELDEAVAWTGFRPVSPDGLPYLGRAPHHANVVVATGHAMMGFSLGPVTGQLVAELVAGEPTTLDVGLLDPGRHG